MDQNITIEYEKTYLLKYIPENLLGCPFNEIIDIYIPSQAEHPNLRIRRRGEKFEICKKTPIKQGDASSQTEFTIPLTKQEFDELNANLQGKRARKYRYYYKYYEKNIEIDVYLDSLKGLILVDIEFESEEEKANFSQPEFCLAEVTQEKVMAGGMIVGKKYQDIEYILNSYNYKPIYLDI